MPHFEFTETFIIDEVLTKITIKHITMMKCEVKWNFIIKANCLSSTVNYCNFNCCKHTKTAIRQHATSNLMHRFKGYELDGHSQKSAVECKRWLTPNTWNIEIYKKIWSSFGPLAPRGPMAFAQICPMCVTLLGRLAAQTYRLDHKDQCRITATRYSSNKPHILSQCHDDNTRNIVVTITIENLYSP